MSVTAYTKSGTKSATAPKLNKDVFSKEVPSFDLLNYAYNAYLANARSAQAVTLTKGKVRGGGRKPWRQKGTGRARAGSIRSPIWRGGGITFGPQGNENYKKPLSKKAKRTAVAQALSVIAKDGDLKIIESLAFKEAKTKEAASLLSKLGVTRKAIVVVDTKTEEVSRAFNNLENVKLVSAKYLSVYDLLNSDSVVMTTGAVAAVDAWLGGKDE